MSLVKSILSFKPLLCSSVTYVNKQLIRLETTTSHIATNYRLKQSNDTKNSNKPRRSSGLYYLILAGSGAAYLTYRLLNNDYNIFPLVSAASIIESPPPPKKLSGRRKQYNFIADVVETSAPAVVYIEIKDTRRVEFFTGKPMTVSNGSGFIIRPDGLILTNAHVVTSVPHSKVSVRLFDGSVHNATIENVDVKSDLATIRISAKNLPTLRLGNSNDLQPGEFVVAIGSPLTLSNTVTSGVVSSTHRASDELGLRGTDMVYIQTDAAITFGNSGGPLVNLDGEAIGINSMKVAAGISFAIPSNYVKQFLAQAQDSGTLAGNARRRNRYMGVTMLTLTPQILNELQQRGQNIPDIKNGVLIWKVIIGSPAHSGGIQPGDIVTHINDKQIKSANDVYAVLSEEKSKNVKLSVNRHGKKIDLHVAPEDVD